MPATAFEIFSIPAFNDNYIWAIRQDSQVYVVDPGCAQSVIQCLESRQLQLQGILVTHWHPDHSGGISALQADVADSLVDAEPLPVIGPRSDKIPQINQLVGDLDQFTIFPAQNGLNIQVLAIPGHTLDHIAFHAPAVDALFCGDTLFSAGCGRVFEGSYAQMQASLAKLAALSPDTLIYCAHEYTLSNLAFALAVEPKNHELMQRLQTCQSLREQQLATLPNRLANELLTNPFLRCHIPDVADAAVQQGAMSNTALDVFTCLRQWKDNF